MYPHLKWLRLKLNKYLARYFLINFISVATMRVAMKGIL